jgi:hypothetical protein
LFNEYGFEGSQIQRGLHAVIGTGQARMSASAKLEATAVKRGNPLRPNDGREGCVHILQG